MMTQLTYLNGAKAMLFFLLVLTATLVPSNAADIDNLRIIATAWQSSVGSRWTGDNYCQWTGVKCGVGDRVTKLELAGRNLSGEIPPQIWELTSLEVLALDSNPNLGGSLSSDVSNLVNLTTLNLQYCALTGLIPESITRLSKLVNLWLNNNKFTGRIPANLSGLKALFYFDISANQVEGPIPTSIGNITTLGHIHFQTNLLNGPIPSEIANLPKLLHLILGDNKLSGPLPELTLLSSITTVEASNNPINDEIPASYFGSPTLVQLNLASCGLTGPDLTSTQWNAPKLYNLDLSSNPKLGGFPSASTLGYINLANNPQVASVATDGWSFIQEALVGSNVQELHLANCSLTGDKSILTAKDLLYLDLSNNKLSPNAVSRVLSQPEITVLLEGNPAICNSGNDPKVVQACSTTGRVGSFISSPEPTVCNANCQAGQPNPIYKILNPYSSDCPCASALVVELRLNQPSFSAPTFQSNGYAKNLSQQLARSFGLLDDQVVVDKDIQTDGSDLLVNTFWWPTDTSSSLDEQTVQYIIGNLSGHKPLLMKPFGIFYVASISRPTDASSARPTTLSPGAIAAIVVGAVVALVLIVALAIFALSLMRRAREAEQSRNIILGKNFGGAAHTGKSDGPRLKGARLFTLAELRKATSGFANDKVLGVGGYGKVYRGKLDDGREVAVKRLAKESHQGPQEFNSEIELLSRVHHRNLVALVGFCNVDGEQMLVYDLMQNGTVKDWLSGTRKPPLSFSKRLEIAAGAAHGLSYLHNDCSPAIIHRDIKSANILLSSHFNAKVADFGLSKNVDPQGEEVTTVKGTLGYLDPDYYNTQILSEKTDVYSFGVVLLELMTGKQPVNKSTRVHISREVKEALAQGSLPGMKDPAFEADFNEESYTSMINLALRCLQEGEDRSLRPSMAVVVKELDAICTAAGVIQEAPTSPTSLRQGRNSVDLDKFAFRSSGEGTTSTFFKSSGEGTSSFFSKSTSRSVSGTKKKFPKSPTSAGTDLEKQETENIADFNIENSTTGVSNVIASWMRLGSIGR